MKGLSLFLCAGLSVCLINGCVSNRFQTGKTTVSEMETAMGPPKMIRPSAGGGTIVAWELEQRAYAFSGDVPHMLLIVTFDKSGVMTGMRRSGSLYTPMPVPVLDRPGPPPVPVWEPPVPPPEPWIPRRLP
jgi:hypothetical protein